MRVDDKFYHVECEPDSTVEDLKCLVNIQSEVAVEQQILYYSQNVLNDDSKKLSDIGIKNNDMVNMNISLLNR